MMEPDPAMRLYSIRALSGGLAVIFNI